MPPSRGLFRPGYIQSNLSRPRISLPNSRRQLSSIALPKTACNGRRIGIAAVAPTTSYILQHGKANLSLWPFGSASIPPPADAANKNQIEKFAQPQATESSSASPPPPASSPPASNATASDAATASVASMDPSAPPAPIDATNAALQEIQDELIEAAKVDNITYIGQLKDLGLDFGWGPTSTMQWLFEHVHVYSGLPWWASILSTALIARLAILPIFYKQSEMAARTAKIQPQSNVLMKERADATREGDQVRAQQAVQSLLVLRRREGIQYRWMVINLFLQIPLGFAAFRLARNMTLLPAPGLTEGGVAWFTDLTVADPYFVLPICVAVFQHLMARQSVGAMAGVAGFAAIMRPMMMYILPSLSFLVCFWQGALLQLVFVFTSLFAVCQARFFMSRSARKMLGMTQMPTQRTAPYIPGGMGDMMNGKSPKSPSTVNTTATSKPAGAAAAPSPFGNLRMRKGTGYAAGAQYKAPAGSAGASAASRGSAEPAQKPAGGVTGWAKKEWNTVKESGQQTWRKLGERMEEKAGEGLSKGERNRDPNYLRRAREFEARQKEAARKARKAGR